MTILFFFSYFYNDLKPIVIQILKVVVFLSVPCVPNNVSVLPSCDDNGATVMWSSSLVATSYLLTATGRDGHVAVCNSTENNCTLTHLHCGQPYSLSVTARGENCTSQPSVSSFRSGKGTLAQRVRVRVKVNPNPVLHSPKITKCLI